MKTPRLFQRILAFVTVLLAFALAGCGEKGDKAILYADGLGRDWKAPAGEAQLRVAVQNSFTSNATVMADGEGRHYEMKVGPIRDRYMIIPAGQYEFSAYAVGRTVGETKLKITPEDTSATSKGFLLQIRP